MPHDPHLSGTVWDIGEAAGPIFAGFLIGRMGCPATFDVLASVIAVITVGLMGLVRDLKRPSGRSTR